MELEISCWRKYNKLDLIKEHGESVQEESVASPNTRDKSEEEEPRKRPTRWDARGWLKENNTFQVSDSSIVILFIGGMLAMKETVEEEGVTYDDSLFRFNDRYIINTYRIIY